MEEYKLLTIKEAQAFTRLSKPKLYQLIQEGILPRVRLPGCTKVLISEADLKRFLQAGIDAGRVSQTA